MVERAEINEQKGKVDVSAVEGRLSKEEGSESLEGREGLGWVVDDLSVGHRCFGVGVQM